MKKVKLVDVFNPENIGKVAVVTHSGNPTVALDIPNAPMAPVIVQKVLNKVLWVMSKLFKNMEVSVGEAEQATSLENHSADVLWHVATVENYGRKFEPLSTDQAIQKWIDDEGLKLYRIV